MIGDDSERHILNVDLSEEKPQPPVPEPVHYNDSQAETDRNERHEDQTVFPEKIHLTQAPSNKAENIREEDQAPIREKTRPKE